MKGLLVTVFFVLSLLSFAQKERKGLICTNPIAVDITDENLQLVPIDNKLTWYSFSSDSMDINFVITASSIGNYTIYEWTDSICSFYQTTTKVSAAEVSKESSFSDQKELSLEELEGVCTCRFCEEGGKKVKLEGGKKYLMTVNGAQTTILVNTRGQKTSSVWKQTAWYEEEMIKGKKLVLENILFIAGETNLLPGSQSDLSKLIEVMKKNITMTIEIQGHVNAPGQRNNKENQDLAAGRAEEVYNYLITKGVFADRLTFSGFGNTQMVYPKPVNEWQQKKNRRVEVLITDI